MIKEYVTKLINDFPESMRNKKCENIDVILSGGIFNGSYLIGGLYFLKEMENHHYIKIKQISSCSIGSIGAILYLINELDIVSEMYNTILENFKKEYSLQQFDNILKKIKEKLPKDFAKNVCGKLYITYYDIQNFKKKVKFMYKNNDELMDIVRRSCSIPFIMDGNILYKNKFCDGIFPYVFPSKTKKILYLDLFGSDKLCYLLSIKNENSNIHRILSGVLDCHLFFIKKTNTQMCSFVEDWCISDWFHHKMKKYVIEFIIVSIIYVFSWVKKNVDVKLYKNTVIFKIINKIIKDVYIILIENYCV
jgi:hypothetical protein